MPNVFLTGTIGSGKSTALNAALSLLAPRRLGGFRTVKSATDIPGAVGVVYIVPADGPALLDEDHRIGIRWGGGRFTPFPDSFENGGCAILAAAPPDADLIIMDELGVMEQEARNFCDAVLGLLDGTVPVLGVIKPQPSPLLDAIRNHHKSRVLEVTEFNRNDMPVRIAGLLR